VPNGMVRPAAMRRISGASTEVITRRGNGDMMCWRAAPSLTSSMERRGRTRCGTLRMKSTGNVNGAKKYVA
jgi:hypothetical protein